MVYCDFGNVERFSVIGYPVCLWQLSACVLFYEMVSMIEKIINDLKNIFVFKEKTQVGDIVLLVAERIIYALVTGIERDYAKKEEWWQVSLQLLTIPPQKIVWTLRTPQFTGQEIFTMGGEERFIKAIDFGGGGASVQNKGGGQIGHGAKKRPLLKLIK